MCFELSQSQLKRFTKDDGRFSLSSDLRKPKGSLDFSDADLEKQLQAWRENPSWADQYSEVKVKECAFCCYHSCCYCFFSGG